MDRGLEPTLQVSAVSKTVSPGPLTGMLAAGLFVGASPFSVIADAAQRSLCLCPSATPPVVRARRPSGTAPPATGLSLFGLPRLGDGQSQPLTLDCLAGCAMNTVLTSLIGVIGFFAVVGAIYWLLRD